MKPVRNVFAATLMFAMSCGAMAQTAEPVEKLLEKLPIEKIIKDSITDADIDMLANVFKSALAGKEVAVPEEFTQRIAGKAEKLRVELTPIMNQLIDEIVRSIKLENKEGQRL
jgi:hypothetical protein